MVHGLCQGPPNPAEKGSQVPQLVMQEVEEDTSLDQPMTSMSGDFLYTHFSEETCWSQSATSSFLKSK